MTRFPRLIRWGLLALLVPSSAGTAQAQYVGRGKVVYDHFDFQQVQTEHFTAYYYPPMEPAAQDAARMAERWARYVDGSERASCNCRGFEFLDPFREFWRRARTQVPVIGRAA